MNALLGFRDVIPATLHGGGRFVLPRKAFTAAYIRAFEEGLLPRRVEQALEALRSCRVFPRDCQIDTFSDKIGVCKSGRYARITNMSAYDSLESIQPVWLPWMHRPKKLRTAMKSPWVRTSR